MKTVLLCLFSVLCVQAQEVQIFSFYFPNDGAHLIMSQKKKADSLKLLFQRDSITIVLTGYANAYASDAYNLKLAQARIKTVKDYLAPLKVNQTDAIGELDGYSWEERRVDATITITERNIPDSTQFKKDEPIATGNKRRMLSSRRLDITSYSELEINEKTVLFGIFFQGGTDRMLGSSSEITLRKLLRFMNGYPNRKIKLTGHICCSMDKSPEEDGTNNRTKSNTLSLDRAKAVYDYLIRKGISPDRMAYEGLAYLEPLDWEETKNRRVEITILE
ncbi:hypothetical protein EAX61_16100 [Dokdonia sinensis]|uniref:OmpA-like domain-containing protein n=1 Tax=Dokdonia sinensis TaxID=2479847 RepID=A0A3M0G2E4_9FLAO|nr:OmpA family protein [Dokdonia sinensis]RMB56073.1 hypothetical protein EAX61_16100 [Dokdonia sinensis]